VLSTGPGRGRLASLLPPVHICLLNADRLYGTMAHFIQAFPDSVRQTSNLVFITGPSRTADIEQTLTLGVHGPGHLYVLLVSSPHHFIDS
jgi:L-lactate dehydrogenase complex protein LldG